jgi:hypothetical protein
LLALTSNRSLALRIDKVKIHRRRHRPVRGTVGSGPLVAPTALA